MRGGTRRAAQDYPGSVCYGTFGGDAATTDTYADSGSAARFFYCAKASKADRDTGLQYHELIRIEATWEDVALNLRLRVDTAQSPPRVIGAFGMPNSDVTAWNTWLFGSEPMGRSLQGCKFTTATRTSSTTDSKTWNCLVRWFTSASIAAVSFVTESGGSHAANAENCDTSAIITNGSTAYLPGVSPAPSGTLFKISAIVEGRRGAEDGDFLRHDLLRHGGEAIEVG